MLIHETDVSLGGSSGIRVLDTPAGPLDSLLVTMGVGLGWRTAENLGRLAIYLLVCNATFYNLYGYTGGYHANNSHVGKPLARATLSFRKEQKMVHSSRCYKRKALR